jgi:hypothetical protein
MAGERAAVTGNHRDTVLRPGLSRL